MSTVKYQVFKAVCHLANRQLNHRQVQVKLFKEVSDVVPSSFNHDWNPAMEGRFLVDLHRYQLPTAEEIQLRFKNSHLLVLQYQKLRKIDLFNIEV